MEVSGQIHAHFRPTPGKKPPVPIEEETGWPRSGPENLEKRKIAYSYWDLYLGQSISWSPYQLVYPGCHKRSGIAEDCVSYTRVESEPTRHTCTSSQCI